MSSRIAARADHRRDVTLRRELSNLRALVRLIDGPEWEAASAELRREIGRTVDALDVAIGRSIDRETGGRKYAPARPRSGA